MRTVFSYLTPCSSSPFPLSIPLESCRQAVTISRRSSALPPPFCCNSGATEGPLRPLLVPIDSPLPGAPPNPLVLFSFTEEQRAGARRRSSPLHPRRTAVPGRKQRRHHLHRLPRVTLHAVDASPSPEDHRSTTDVHDRAAGHRDVIFRRHRPPSERLCMVLSRYCCIAKHEYVLNPVAAPQRPSFYPNPSRVRIWAR